MISHVTLHVADIDTSKELYEKMLAPLGYAKTAQMDEWKVVGMGVNGVSDLWLVGDAAGTPPGHIAFGADSKDAVQGAYDAALSAGAKDNGAPGYRKDYSPSYYAAFVHDLDGHNIEFVFNDPSPTE
jgi:catechol 2,3-dioxygenase-like lactoylglutathione lyase family enzyme